MTTRTVASVGNFFSGHFPERQIYHRSRGAVQFMVLSAPMQVFLLLLTLAFLGWVAYASVNVVFKDQIIAAKEQHFATMQAAYEGRLAEMQASYDELNGALVLTESRFEKATTDLQQRHDQLSTIINRQEAAIDHIKELKTRIATALKKQPDQRNGTKFVMGTGDDAAASDSVSEWADGAVDSETGEPLIAETPVKTSRPGGKATVAPVAAAGPEGGPELPVSGELGDRVDNAALIPADKPTAAKWSANVTAAMPTTFAEDTRRIDGRLTTLDAAQREMVAVLQHAARRQVADLQALFEKTGLNVERVLETVADAGGDPTAPESARGGPFLPAENAIDVAKEKLGATTKPVSMVDRLQSDVDRLAGLESALASLPLVNPLEVEYRVTSGFGKRYDPFTNRPAYHYGLDMVAPLKTEVHVTAPGRVVVAGRTGPYGLMVEIDHGNGLHTRYGHLYAVKVKVGDTVKFQDVIGLLGSTGRSTGPHLHYEVRFNGTLRDPARFLEAGRYVFQG